MRSNYKVLIAGKDVTSFVGQLQWSDSIETLGVKLSFTLATNRLDPSMEFLWGITLGDSVQVVGKDGSIVDGIIVEEEPGQKVTNFVAFDFAWYLNKSTVIKQFKKMEGNECVAALCKDLGIETDCKGLDAYIDKIYKDKTVSQVIRDIIEQCSVNSQQEFFMEFANGKLVIHPFEKIEVKGRFEIAANEFIDIAEAIGEVRLSRSIVDLKNAVLVVSADKEATRVEGIAEDKESIAKYGKIQSVIELDEKDFGKADLVAKNELRKKNRVRENFSVQLLGDDKVKAGRVIRLDFAPVFPLAGTFLVKESYHSLANGIHKMELTLEVFKDE